MLGELRTPWLNYGNQNQVKRGKRWRLGKIKQRHAIMLAEAASGVCRCGAREGEPHDERCPNWTAT